MTRSPAGRVVTLTANPSLDRTLALPAALERGGVVRLGASSTEPGGKGVNVARAVAAAGGDVVSVLPAADDDPIVSALRALGLRPGHGAGRGRRPHQLHAHRARRHDDQAQRAGHPAGRRRPGGPHRRAAPARRRGALGGAVRLAAAGHAGRLVRDPGPRAARHRRAHRRRHLRGPAAGAAGRRPGRGARPAQAEHRGAGPAGRRVRGRDPAPTPRRPLAAVRTLHDRGVAEVLLTLGADGALLSTRGRRAVVGPPAPDHRAQHGRRRRLQPGRLPARLPGRRPAGRAAADRGRLRLRRGLAARIRASHPGPGRRLRRPRHRRDARRTAVTEPPPPPPSRPPAGTPADVLAGEVP